MLLQNNLLSFCSIIREAETRINASVFSGLVHNDVDFTSIRLPNDLTDLLGTKYYCSINGSHGLVKIVLVGN